MGFASSDCFAHGIPTLQQLKPPFTIYNNVHVLTLTLFICYTLVSRLWLAGESVFLHCTTHFSSGTGPSRGGVSHQLGNEGYTTFEV